MVRIICLCTRQRFSAPVVPVCDEFRVGLKALLRREFCWVILAPQATFVFIAKRGNTRFSAQAGARETHTVSRLCNFLASGFDDVFLIGDIHGTLNYTAMTYEPLELNDPETQTLAGFA